MGIYKCANNGGVEINLKLIIDKALKTDSKQSGWLDAFCTQYIGVKTI